jgi:broad-specificity NMP kinase
MRLIILGAPGSGKGSQCKWITRDYNVPHISTGDILRKNIADGTVLGQKAKGYMYNTSGLIYSVFDLEEGLNIVDMPIHKGVYVIRLVYNNGEVEVVKIVIG